MEIRRKAYMVSSVSAPISAGACSNGLVHGVAFQIRSFPWKPGAAAGTGRRVASIWIALLCALLQSYAFAQEAVSIPDLNRFLMKTPGAPALPEHVKFRGVVIHRDESLRSLLVFSDGSGVAVRLPSEGEVASVGAEVEVTVMGPARFASGAVDTILTADTVQVTGTPGLPAPTLATLGDVVSGRVNRKAVEVEATVLGATLRGRLWRLFLYDGETAANGTIYHAPADWNGEALRGARIAFRGGVAGSGPNALRSSDVAGIRVLQRQAEPGVPVIEKAETLVRGGIDEARRGRPVRLRGVCTYPNSKRIHFYLHDGTGGVVVNLNDPSLCPAYGEQVEITGVSSGYQNVIGVTALDVSVVGRGTLPEAQRVPVSQTGGALFSQWLEVEGSVVQALANSAGAVRLQIAADGGWCSVMVVNGTSLMQHWEGARVRCRGVNASYGNLVVFCGEPGLVEVLQPGMADAFQAPILQRGGQSQIVSGERIQISGVISGVHDNWVYVRSGQMTARAELFRGFPVEAGWETRLTRLAAIPSMEPGQQVQLVGSYMGKGDDVTLRYAQVRVAGDGPAPEARPTTPKEIMGGGRANDLVMVRARMDGYSARENPTAPEGARWTEVVYLEKDGAPLEVVLEGASLRSAFAGLKVNDLIEATGLVRPEAGTPPFRLLVRNPAEVHTLGVAPEVLWKQQMRIWMFAGAAVLAAAFWVLLLRGKLQRERQLAAERMRADEAVRTLNASLEARVTERTAELQKTQEDLQRALVTEREMSELKSRFVALVSHEFRTPLGITLSAVELLRGYAERLPEDQRKELLEDIHGATVRMAGMMEQVLLLGRVEAQAIAKDAQPLDVENECEKIVEEIRASTKEKCPINFHSAGELEGAKGDEALFRHIFCNLLSNAVKYSESGARVDFGLKREEGAAVFTIRDHGIGIPKEDQARLFEAFYRAGNVGTTPGTGLGLLIVKRCVDLCGGTISFDSKTGEGTTFTVRLPLFQDRV